VADLYEVRLSWSPRLRRVVLDPVAVPPPHGGMDEVGGAANGSARILPSWFLEGLLTPSSASRV